LPAKSTARSDDVITAIAREKELKKWRRDWKIHLIEEQKPGWVDPTLQKTPASLPGFAFLNSP
jgi:predicted GIY-YIG superfamily endonuclease